MATLSLGNTPPVEVDSDDEFDWEEVEVPEQQPLEITLHVRPKSDVVAKKKGISHAERLIRIDTHKIHTVCLLANAWVRNKWINDPLLHARLLSLAPLPLQNAFAMIHKSRVPDQNKRGRLFESAITHLAEWWSSTFFEVTIDGHIRNRTFDDVQKGLATQGLATQGLAVSTPIPTTPAKGQSERQRSLDAAAIDMAAIDLELLQEALNDDGEAIRSPNSLMKHALMRSGSRDTSAQLFTALCRAMGIPARLVVSLQSVPWQAGIGKPKPKYERKKNRAQSKGKGKEIGNEAEDGEGDTPGPVSASASVSGSEMKVNGKGKARAESFRGEGQRLDGGPVGGKSEKAKGKEKARPVIKLRKGKSKGNVLGTRPTVSSPASGSSPRYTEPPDPTITPPVFWTEVFSRPDARWLPVDPIRCIVNKRKVFDPTPSSSTAPTSTSTPSANIFPHPYAVPKKQNLGVTSGAKQENRMVYVLAFEEDGYAKDVTRRYAREFGAKVVKAQGGKGRKEWWERVMGVVKRPYRLHRDDLEDEELEANQMMEGMPTTITGFKDHPLYVLSRHLRQTQTIHPAPPLTPELGKFRGEPVYPRSAVVELKTSENWMRSEGRRVKEGCQPMKFVKIRAGTVGRLREVEGLREAGVRMNEGEKDGERTGIGAVGQAGGGEVMQGLYARSQTEVYVPDPVVDGKVPKNNFGNIDLYVPSMLPEGAAHVPFKGVAKIARKLGFDYAEAVTGFEFKKRRAFPIVEGVVIPAENEAALLEAYWEAEQDAEEKARIKREERVVKRWIRLVHGLRIRQRLQEQYQGKPKEEQVVQGPKHDVEGDNDADIVVDVQQAGAGFLVGADDVVQAFHLPKSQHLVIPLTPPPAERIGNGDTDPKGAYDDVTERISYDLETMDVDSDMEDVIPVPHLNGNHNGVPKTMRELAEDAVRKQDEGLNTSGRDNGAGSGDGEEYHPSPPPDLAASKSTSATKNTRPIRTKRAPPTGGRTPPTAENKSLPKTRGRGSAKKRAREDEEESSPETESQSSPAKRGRAKVVATVARAASTRVLRPRLSKSESKIQEEKEQEEAFRRAVAE